ncbi:MAG: MarR family transcriptional regulator, partial [Candidatus Dormibacteraceae bacterium]
PKIKVAIELAKHIACSECGEDTGRKAKSRDEAVGKSKSALCRECLRRPEPDQPASKPEPVQEASHRAELPPVTRQQPVSPPNAEVPERQRPRATYQVAPETPEQIKARSARGRDMHRGHIHLAMLNGSPGSNNHALTDAVRTMLEKLVDLSSCYTPEDAASQIPSPQLMYLCNDGLGEWLLEFSRECDKRRQVETPKLAPVSSHSTEYKKAEMDSMLGLKGLQPAQRRVLDWLASNGRSTVQDVMDGTGMGRHVENCIRALEKAGLLAKAGVSDNRIAYEVTGKARESLDGGGHA